MLHVVHWLWKKKRFQPYMYLDRSQCYNENESLAKKFWKFTIVFSPLNQNQNKYVCSSCYTNIYGVVATKTQQKYKERV